ncbi:MAG: hypothetical protein ACREJB_03210, partial [Planctomycetaceae bacterium]
MKRILWSSLGASTLILVLLGAASGQDQDADRLRELDRRVSRLESLIAEPAVLSIEEAEAELLRATDELEYSKRLVKK